jgi:hypothetical protein
MTEPDGIKILVPATWEVPGVGANQRLALARAQRFRIPIFIEGGSP